MVSSLMKFRKMLRFVPTGLTVGNALCGFTAILNTMLAYKATPEEIPGIFETSAWLIVCAMLFDMFDGWTARKLNATSEYGKHWSSNLIGIRQFPGQGCFWSQERVPIRIHREPFYSTSGEYVACQKV